MKEVTGVLYEITFPDGMSYVGRSISFEARVNRYRTEKQQTSPVYLHIRKYGFDNIEIKKLVVIEGERDEVNRKLNELEEEEIQSRSPEYLLNVRRSDYHPRVYTHTEKSKEKMSISQKGRKHSKESRLRRSGHSAYQGKSVSSDKLKITFPTLKSAANYVGVAGGCKISEFLKGERKSVGKHPVTRERIDDWKWTE